MCGIFGVIPKKNFDLDTVRLKHITDRLFKLSESRGKEAAGIAIRTDSEIYVYKSPTSSSRMIRSSEYKKIFRDLSANKNNLAIIGHSRLVTNGAQILSNNNQPVIKSEAVAIHNGIVTNIESVWKRFPLIKRMYEVDTEIIPSLIQEFNKQGDPLIRAVQKTFNNIKGAASIAVFFNNKKNIILATNTGSLYACTNKAKNIFIFASEKYILQQLIKKQFIKKLLGKYKISQLEPCHGYLINLITLKIDKFSFGDEIASEASEYCDESLKLKIIDLSLQQKQTASNIQQETKKINYKELTKNFDKFSQNIDKLRRCTNCILPETMPFIEFDDKGVCNYCKSYKKINLKGEGKLENFIAKYKSTNKSPDCIVTFSGGRDSSYMLHYVKNILKMNPVAYTYDWGMITDLGRRNQARICGKLGIEHILVSADINKKRQNIRKNVKAWLRRPDLGTIPLFMAGDKQYFYYANKLRKQMRVKLIIIGTNLLETTKFKSGFCGVTPIENSPERPYALSSLSQIKLATYYARQYLLNPYYFNSSVLDTLFAFFSYYSMPHEFLNIYQYIPWDERKIESLLIKEYDWEVAKDTPTTWRIGDGTASFYNYIYNTIAGFTENDTFRSNQIREGVIDRTEALKLVKRENKPRYESLKWYCDTIGVDFHTTIKIINSIAKLYDQK